MSNIAEITTAIKHLSPETIEARRREIREEDKILRVLLRRVVRQQLDELYAQKDEK